MSLFGDANEDIFSRSFSKDSPQAETKTSVSKEKVVLEEEEDDDELFSTSSSK